LVAYNIIDGYRDTLFMQRLAFDGNEALAEDELVVPGRRRQAGSRHGVSALIKPPARFKTCHHQHEQRAVPAGARRPTGYLL